MNNSISVFHVSLKRRLQFMWKKKSKAWFQTVRPTYIQEVLVQLLQDHKTKKHQTNIKLVALTQISKLVVHAEHFLKESKIIYQ